MTESQWLVSNNPAEMLRWLTMNSTERVGEYAERRLAASVEARILQMPEPKVPLVWPNASDRKLRLFCAACINARWPGENRGFYYDNERPHSHASLPGWAVDWAVLRSSVEVESAIGTAPEDFDATRAAILRDIFGNPWRPVVVTHTDRVLDSWWTDHVVLRMAQAFYADRDFDYLPILADALEDAGCDDEEILVHCRGAERCSACLGSGDPLPHGKNRYRCLVCNATGWIPLRGPHVRGCWVLDLVLGKE